MGPVTAMEAELGDLGQGPDRMPSLLLYMLRVGSWPEAKVLSSGVLHSLEGCSDHLHSHVAALFWRPFSPRLWTMDTLSWLTRCKLSSNPWEGKLA